MISSHLACLAGCSLAFKVDTTYNAKEHITGHTQLPCQSLETSCNHHVHFSFAHFFPSCSFFHLLSIQRPINHVTMSSRQVKPRMAII